MNTINEWADRWNIPVQAMTDLRVQLGQTCVAGIPSVDCTGESEAAVQTRVRMEASQAGGRLWRNNVGACQTVEGGFIRYGLANESTAMNKRCKSSDLIGLRPVLITEEMVGGVFGLFVAREVKHGGWKYTGSAREKSQKKFSCTCRGHGRRRKIHKRSTCKMNGIERKQRADEFALIGMNLAERSSYIQVKREQIAAAAGVASSSVNYALGGAEHVRNAIITKAIECENVTVLAQAIAMRHPLAVNAPRLLKARAVQLLGTY